LASWKTQKHYFWAIFKPKIIQKTRKKKTKKTLALGKYQETSAQQASLEHSLQSLKALNSVFDVADL
jgi:hypothetical protein